MSVDLETVAAQVELPDEAARAAVRERLGSRAGRLGDLATWLAGAQGRPDLRRPERARLVVVAGDRGPGSAAAAVRALLDGVGPVAATAEDVGAGVQVVEVSLGEALGPSTSSLVVAGGPVGASPVCSVSDAQTGFAAGVAVADELADSGSDLLVVTHVGAGAAAATAALAVLLGDLELTSAVDRSGGDAAWVRDVAGVRDAARRARPILADRIALLAEVGGADLAATTGLLLRAASRRTPVVLDGATTTACALLAHRIAYRCAHWWLAPDTGSGPTTAAFLERLSLEPVADLHLPGPPGLAGLLAVPLLRAAAAL